MFNIPINIRKYTFANNIVKSVNSALNIIFLNLEDLETKCAKSKVNNWKLCPYYPKILLLIGFQKTIIKKRNLNIV